MSTVLTAYAAPPQDTLRPSGPVLLAAEDDSGGPAILRPGATRDNDENLPSVELTDELLFKLLRAELASQRGEWQLAYVTMLVSAQQTRDPRLARRAAEIALNAKQSGEALAAIRLWRELAPESEEATQYYLGFVMLNDKLSEAKPVFEQRLKEARPQARGLLMLQIQRLLSRSKDKAAAFTLLEELMAPYQSTLEARMVLSQSALLKGDAERARAEARAALALRPDSELAVLMLAQATTDKTEALQVLSAFLNANPSAREVRLAYAKLLVEEKQIERAKIEFEALHKAQPNDLTSLYALGILAAQTDDTANAEKYLTSYVEKLTAKPDEQRDPSQAYLILAQLAEERKDDQAALKWLSRVEPGTAYVGAMIKRSQLIAKSGDLQGARSLLTTIATDGEREQTQVIVADAQLLRDANRLPDAMAVLAEGLKRFPENTGLLYDYAMVAEKAGKLDVMETSLRSIIRIAPDNQHAYNALGYSLAERNIRLNEAHGLIEKALALAPEDPFIIDSMGWVQFRMGRLNEAEQLLRRAYALRPDVEIGVHLGEVLWVKGQKEDAATLWRDARKKDPDNDTLKSTLARLQVKL